MATTKVEMHGGPTHHTLAERGRRTCSVVFLLRSLDSGREKQISVRREDRLGNPLCVPVLALETQRKSDACGQPGRACARRRSVALERVREEERTGSPRHGEEVTGNVYKIH